MDYSHQDDMRMQEPAGPTLAPAPPGVISWDQPCAEGSSGAHWLPVRVPHGATAASNADDSTRIQLTICVDPEDSSRLTTFLRGRELRGAKVALPDGYVCVALEQQPMQRAAGGEDCDMQDQEGAKHWKAAHTYESVTLWGHDQVPAKGEPAQRCIEFLRLAQKVHAPASLDQVEEQLRQLNTTA